MRRSLLFIAAVLATLSLAAATPTRAWIISVHNDLKDTKDRNIKIQDVRTAGGKKKSGLVYVLQNKTKQLAEKDVISFVVERRLGKEEGRVWMITLPEPGPEDKGKTIMLNFSDIRDGKLPKGFLVKQGRWTKTNGTQWSE